MACEQWSILCSARVSYKIDRLTEHSKKPRNSRNLLAVLHKKDAISVRSWYGFAFPTTLFIWCLQTWRYQVKTIYMKRLNDLSKHFGSCSLRFFTICSDYVIKVEMHVTPGAITKFQLPQIRGKGCFFLFYADILSFKAAFRLLTWFFFKAAGLFMTGIERRTFQT